MSGVSDGRGGCGACGERGVSGCVVVVDVKWSWCVRSARVRAGASW